MLLIMEGFAISKGDRGEFLVLLFFIMARDGLVGPVDHLFKPLRGKRTDTSSADTLDMARKWTDSEAHLRLWSLSRAISPTRNYT